MSTRPIAEGGIARAAAASNGVADGLAPGGGPGWDRALERLRAEGLSKEYLSGGERLVVFQDLAFTVEPGEMVAVVGESGSGKSSLLHVLSGLDRPSQGDVYFGQRSLRGLGDDELAAFRNREIGFLWQFHYLLPEFTARENVMMPLLAAGTGEREAARRAQDWLEQVGLGPRAEHRAGELSGGEQQRTALARALVAGPRWLMADEPTGNLDEATGGRIFSLLARLHREHHLSSILVTHNPAFANRCDRVLRLHACALEPQA
ncbi:MAG: ABC transporter ATP-binding protein [Terriglobales bacterium]